MANSDGYPWESAEDQLEYTRVFIPSRAEQFQMDQALALQNAPGNAIREMLMTPPPMPPRYGLAGRGIDILSCWQESAVPATKSIMDYTDDEAGIQSTARPSLGQW